MREIVPLTLDAARYVADRMRPADAREIWATAWGDVEPATLAWQATSCAPFAWCALLDGEPVAAFGAGPIHPGVWRVFLFATDKFRHVGFRVTKFFRHVMIPALFQSGAHRLECLSIAGHHEAHRWIEFLGAIREATLKEYGRNLEDFYVYVLRANVRSSERQERVHRATAGEPAAA